MLTAWRRRPGRVRAPRGLDAFTPDGARQRLQLVAAVVGGRQPRGASWASTSWPRSGTARRFVRPTASSRCSRIAAAASGSPRARRSATAAAHRLRLVVEAGEELLGLVEPALQDADLGEPHGRVHAARALSRVGRARGARSTAPPPRRRLVRARRARPRSRCGRRRAAPRGRTCARTPRTTWLHCFGRSASPASSHAVSITCSRRPRTSPGVVASPLIVAARASSSRERPSSTLPAPTSARPSCVSARSSRSVCLRAFGDCEGGRGESGGRRGIAGPLRPGERQPALLRAGRRVLQETLRAGEPAVRGRFVAPDERVLAREPEGDPRGALELVPRGGSRRTPARGGRRPSRRRAATSAPGRGRRAPRGQSPSSRARSNEARAASQSPAASAS